MKPTIEEVRAFLDAIDTDNEGCRAAASAALAFAKAQMLADEAQAGAGPGPIGWAEAADGREKSRVEFLSAIRPTPSAGSTSDGKEK